MNILTLILCMLMIFSILTYGRMESFRNFTLIQKDFEEAMEGQERAKLSKAMRKIYEDSTASQRASSPGKQMAKGCSKINFRLFVNKDFRKANATFLDNYRNIAKRLMENVFGQRKSLQADLELRPDLFDAILLYLQNIGDNPDTMISSIQVAKLKTLSFDDITLRNGFLTMCEGFKTSKGREVSLLDFITLTANKGPQIHVYLAPREILFALFGDETIVREIQAMRKELYKDLDKENQAELSQTFKETFLLQRLPDVPEEILDFTVTGTRP